MRACHPANHGCQLATKSQRAFLFRQLSLRKPSRLRMFVFKKAEKDKSDAKESATYQQVALTAAAFFGFLAVVRATPYVIKAVRGY